MTTKQKKKAKKTTKNAVRRWLKEQHKNQHHIVPRSKFGSHSSSNIAFVDVEKHQDLHKLFSNKTPEESIDYLVNYFWKGNWGFVVEALANAN